MMKKVLVFFCLFIPAALQSYEWTIANQLNIDVLACQGVSGTAGNSAGAPYGRGVWCMTLTAGQSGSYPVNGITTSFGFGPAGGSAKLWYESPGIDFGQGGDMRLTTAGLEYNADGEWMQWSTPCFSNVPNCENAAGVEFEQALDAMGCPQGAPASACPWIYILKGIAAQFSGITSV